MKKLLYAIVGFGFVFCAAARAQEYRTPEWNGCIRQYYDPNMYNWLSFENRCGESLYIVFIANNPGYGASAMTLGPGRSNSTGLSAREIREKQGLEIYACPVGYVPVDDRNSYLTRVVQEFRCKRQ